MEESPLKNRRIRGMVEADLKEVAQIEKETYTDPWSRKMFSDHLASPSSIDLLLEQDGIIGFACTTIIPDYLIGIDNLTIRKEHQRYGYGSLLLSHILEQGKKRGVTTFTLEVRESNQAGIGLYSKFGFVICGKRKSYYHSPVEDALIMTKE